jgi:hypothetical protein
MKRNILVVAVIITAFVLGSCGKYEEGPAFSLKSKKARLAGTWQIEKVLENGKEVPLEEGDDLNMTWTFEKDGTGKVNLTFGQSYSMDMEWKFSDNKEELQMRTKFGSEWSEWESMEILRLTNKEFWGKNTNTEDGETVVIEMHFKKV